MLFKDFAYVDSKGKGHLPIGDAAHVRAALTRFGQTFFESEAKAKTAWSHIMAAAKKFGIKHEGPMPRPKIKEASEGYKRASAGIGGDYISVCAVAIAAEGAPNWIELIPAGRFSAVDGRGPFENEKPEQVVAASIAKMPAVGLVLDYDHSTDLAAPEGRPAPAAGWIKHFKVENGAIFAQVEWTSEAAEALKEKKYRYVSPVFEHDKQGKVERILRAALTNNPALINLPALASALTRGTAALGKDGEKMARKDGEKKPKLSEVMAALEAAYPDAGPEKLMKAAACLMADDGEEPDGDEGAGQADGGEHMDAADGDPYMSESGEQMAARQAEEMAKCTSEEERSAMAKKHEGEKERFANRSEHAAMSARPRVKQMSREELERAVAKHPMVVKMAADLNEMRAAQAKEAATQKVDAAIRDGRLVPSQRDWAIAYCSSDQKGFEKFIGAQPKILQSGADGTFTGRIGEAPADALTQSELAVCANLQITPEKFIAARKARMSQNVHIG